MRLDLYHHRTDGRYRSGRRVWLFVRVRLRGDEFAPQVHVEVGPHVFGIVRHVEIREAPR